MTKAEQIMEKIAGKVEFDDRTEAARPVSRTLGRVGSLIGNTLIFWKPGTSFRDAKIKTVKQEVNAVMKQHKNLPDLKVRVNAVDTVDDLKRLWRNKRLWPTTKLIGTPSVLVGNASSSLLRSDHYNPLTDTPTIYSDLPAVAAHEAGHHTSFGKSKWPYVRAVVAKIPGISLYEEARASSAALKSVSKKQGDKYKKTLYPAFGSYAGMAIFANPILGAAAGHVLADGGALRAVRNAILFDKRDEDRTGKK